MAWTTPMTWIDNTVLTAAQLNTNIRDNFFEMAAQKSTNNHNAGGGYFVTETPHKIGERGIIHSILANTNSTTSTTYTDMEIRGPGVRAVTGKQALVIFSCFMGSNNNDNISSVGIQVIHAGLNGKVIEPRDEDSLVFDVPNGGAIQLCKTIFFTDLEPGENKFVMQYKASAGTASFGYRRITVLPL